MRIFSSRLLLATALLAALAGCTVYDEVLYSRRAGTVEQPGSAAEPGQPAIYVVASGDTVYGIGRRFNVAPQTIIERNSLTAPYTIRVGQWLELPASGVSLAAGPVPASTGTVTSGSVTSEALPPPSGATAAPSTGAPTTAAPSAAAPTSVTPPAASSPAPAPQASAPSAASPNAAAPQVAATPAPLPTGPVSFAWPLRGQIVAGFGPQPGGVQNDGVNIAAAAGTPVKAAAPGNVLYAGEEVRGFGKLVLIGHADGYVSAYAHNEEILVARGSQVAKGQVIAKVGQTGNVTSPQLHFEIRQRNKAVDPLPLLGQ
ncbi:MAG: peptidoglycan DD-metalloendopeptidase family protein [Reyranellaceae bacterium]